MNYQEIVTAETANLTNCDREQIHIPGSIQPHGLLFVLQEPQSEIIQVSNNSLEILGIHPHRLLEEKLSTLLDDQQVELIRQCLEEQFEATNPLKITINNQSKTKTFEGIVHRTEGGVILELEPTAFVEKASLVNFHYLLISRINRLRSAKNLSDLLEVIVKEIRNITGFDRVMIYQFDSSGSGSVIAEDKQDNLAPFLGLNYPDTDIPKQAKKLYTLNSIRLIPNVNYQPAKIVSAHNNSSNQPVDLSFSVLRSVSPLHIEYLQNMGVTASMSISIIKNRKLWGLIACHHYQPKYLSYEVRTVCEFLGQFISLELAARTDQEDQEYRIKLKSIQSSFVEIMSQKEDLIDALVNPASNLLDIVSAQGVAVCLDNQITCLGKTPKQSEVKILIDWIQEQFQDNLFQTNSLPQLYPPAKQFKDVASGLLALCISKVKRYYILWFRPEVLQTVSWAGDPEKPKVIEEDGSVTISPRKSFTKWQETVQDKSLPWTRHEIDGAMELRSSIVGIVLKKADELAQINLELGRSNSELDAFAYIASHDLKEPLRGIHNYSNFLLEDYADALDEEGVDKLKTLIALTQRMEDLINSLLHFSRLGRINLSLHKTDLNQLIKNISTVFKASRQNGSFEIRVSQLLPIIYCDAIQINELFSNLISNAFKYNNREDKWAEIGCLESSPQSDTIFYVKDNGIGIREKHLDSVFRLFKRLHSQKQYGGGTGAGLTIVQKIVERHNGRIWVESTYGEGSTFYFTLPQPK
ncbi:MAG: ATP-binding protein [Coleofasciculaceae cyanobacterium]